MHIMLLLFFNEQFYYKLIHYAFKIVFVLCILHNIN